MENEQLAIENKSNDSQERTLSGRQRMKFYLYLSTLRKFNLSIAHVDDVLEKAESILAVNVNFPNIGQEDSVIADVDENVKHIKVAMAAAYTVVFTYRHNRKQWMTEADSAVDRSLAIREPDVYKEAVQMEQFQERTKKGCDILINLLELRRMAKFIKKRRDEIANGCIYKKSKVGISEMEPCGGLLSNFAKCLYKTIGDLEKVTTNVENFHDTTELEGVKHPFSFVEMYALYETIIRISNILVQQAFRKFRWEYMAMKNRVDVALFERTVRSVEEKLGKKCKLDILEEIVNEVNDSSLQALSYLETLAKPHMDPGGLEILDLTKDHLLYIATAKKKLDRFKHHGKLRSCTIRHNSVNFFMMYARKD